ncbi:MAG: hypothetical protein V4517_18040 [Pseudomonadota bacterium]
MTARSAFPLIVALTLFWLAPVSPALAEPTETDQKIQRAAQANPASGLVFLEARFHQDGETSPKLCQKIWVWLVPDQGKRTILFSQVSPTLFGRAADSSTYGGWAVLDPGVYTVAQVWCEGPAGINAPGMFARFAVQTGQVLNLGCLVIDFKLGPVTLFERRRDSGDWRVEDLTPLALASLRKEAPVAFSKATKRHMTPMRQVSKPKLPQ